MSLDQAVRDLRRAFAEGLPYADAFNRVISSGATADNGARDNAIAALLHEPGTRPQIVGELAIASGALVEQGGSATESLGVLLDALADGVSALAAVPDKLDLDKASGPPVGGWTPAFRRLVVGAMARLARSVAAREQARAHPRLVDAMRALTKAHPAWHATYISECLDMLDDTPILLVDQTNDAVSRLRVTGIRNCFHLFTVLEGHDPASLAGESVSTHFGYYIWRYLQITSNLAADIIQTMIPGDFQARDLPMFDGVRVVVRTKDGPHRSWDTAFVAPIHDALKSSIVVETQLSSEEARALRERMAKH